MKKALRVLVVKLRERLAQLKIITNMVDHKYFLKKNCWIYLSYGWSPSTARWKLAEKHGVSTAHKAVHRKLKLILNHISTIN